MSMAAINESAVVVIEISCLSEKGKAVKVKAVKDYWRRDKERPGSDNLIPGSKRH